MVVGMFAAIHYVLIIVLSISEGHLFFFKCSGMVYIFC
jgi:hypothetical protein